LSVFSKLKNRLAMPKICQIINVLNL
jgi:hypothetical protein